jgi:hypothetical protein
MARANSTGIEILKLFNEFGNAVIVSDKDKKIRTINTAALQLFEVYEKHEY